MILTVLVKPGARETKITGWRDSGTVMISLSAPPVDGKANRALIDFLANKLGIAKSHITIKRGQGGRVKHIELPDETNLDQIKGS